MRRLALVATLALGLALTPSAAQALVGLDTAIVTNTVSFSGSYYDVTVSCPSGYKVLGGGWYEDGSDYTGNAQLNVRRSYPNSTTSWEIDGSIAGTSPSGSITVYAVCGQVL